MPNTMHAQRQMPQPFPEMPSMLHMPSMPAQQMQDPRKAQPAAKSYPCSTCGKQFARRSDLARHERIHSGHRPHVCDYPNCGKMFIQRSALTVHQRVHTGEKPHHCEICAKRFSDSSSLARHRRTHLGQRQYKCPYADCQKEFARKTTLNRHRNLHSGTIEKSRVAADAALTATKPRGTIKTSPEGHHFSNHGSPISTLSPTQRTMSMSPSVDLSGMGHMGRHAADVQYIQTGHILTHMRLGSPVSTSSNGFNFNSAMQPTSQPTDYGRLFMLDPDLTSIQRD